MLTLALVLGAPDPEARRGRVARWAVATVLATTLSEAGWITLQGARGLPSHFAQTPFGAAMYALMGAFATLLVAATAVLGLLLLRAPRAGAEPVLARAAGLGLLLSGLAGLATGWAISLNGASVVEVVPPGGAPAVPLFGWAGVAGGLRVAQALPLLGLALGGRRGARGVLTGAALPWSALVLGAMLQALAGHPAIPFGG